MPKFPNRRRSAGNSRRRRGRQSSHKPTASRLQNSTTKVRGTSPHILTFHHAEPDLIPTAHIHAQNGHTLVEDAGSAAESSVSPTVEMA